MSDLRDAPRLREIWNNRYADFTLSESGWFGAGEPLNDRIYACKRQAIRGAIAALHCDGGPASVLDAGCGQGYFARFYRAEFPASRYVGLDISERAIAHLTRAMPDAEFHVADISEWHDPAQRTFRDGVICARAGFGSRCAGVQHQQSG